MDTRASTYLETHGVKGLHIGCGHSVQQGWLNVDIYPQSPEVVPMDATAAFPFADNTFDLAFSEHTIEHITFGQGLSMLKECFRVLKPGGRIRITTPDLETLIRVYQAPLQPLHRDYIRWSLTHFVPDAPSDAPGFFLNNFVRCWGHLFVYDRRTLEIAFVEAGFRSIHERLLNESSEPRLRNLETLSRMPEGFLQLESLTYEGIKPMLL